MSELINNQAQRIQTLKEVILHLQRVQQGDHRSLG